MPQAIFAYHLGMDAEQYAFFRIPKLLITEPYFRRLSTDAKLLYGLMLDRMSLSMRNGWMDDDGHVYIYFTLEEACEQLCCKTDKAVKLFAELDSAKGVGLIRRVKQGLGRPAKIYVLRFMGIEDEPGEDTPEPELPSCRNPDFGKTECNKTDKNNTEMNETYPFNSEETDGMSQREQLEEYFSQSLEVELLLRLCPDDEDIIYQLVDLLVDTCATKRKMLRIAGDDRPAKVVRSRFMKLNADHIKFVLKCLAENSSPIRNMKQYLLASLYNAPTTMQLYYQNQTNHDLAKRG